MDFERTLADLDTTIEAAVAAERADGLQGRVAGVIRDAAARNGDAIGDAEVGRGLDFVIRYVRAVPKLMQEALASSQGTFAEDKMTRMVAAAAAYWDAEEDVIHDDEGLLGILDDAYCTVSLLLALSARFEKEAGSRLVAADLAGPTTVVRKLLGEPIAVKLDDYVVEALADASVSELLESLKEQPLPPPPTHSSWATEDEDYLILERFGVL